MHRGSIRLLVGITAVLTLFLLFAPVLTTLAEEIPTTGAESIRYRLLRVVAPRPETDTGILVQNPALIAGSIVRAALTLIGLIFLILTVYGGSLYLTAGGNEETVKKAKNIIVRTMIGVLIVLFAGAITQFIVSQIQSPGGSEACTPGDSYPTTLLGGCDRPGYSQTGLTCECN